MAPRLIPSEFSCTARANVVFALRQNASITARSTSEVPKCASNGGVLLFEAHEFCCSYNDSQNAYGVVSVISLAASSARTITASISATSASRGLSGIFVNHFGGRQSDEMPTAGP